MKSITNERLNLFVTCGKHYLNNTKKSKLWFAVDKILKGAVKQLKKVNERKDEVRREFALKLDKGVFDTNENGTFKYDVEGNKKIVAALAVIDAETCEINTHIIPEGQYDDNPELLSFDIRNAFEGIVIPEIDYENFDIDKFEEPKPPTV